MTSSDKVNENAPEQQEQKSVSQKSKTTLPNAGMMGANAVWRLLKEMKMEFLLAIHQNQMRVDLLLKSYGYLIMSHWQ